MNTSKKGTLFLVFILLIAMLLAACGNKNTAGSSGPATPQKGQYVAKPTNTPPPDLSCNAIENNPRGSFRACIDSHCSTLRQEYIISYAETSDVDKCSNEGVVAVCAYDNYTIYYYEGDVDALAKNCQYFIGEFSTP